MSLFAKSRDYLFFTSCMLASNLTLAQKAGGGGGSGGVQKVNTFLQNILAALNGASIAVVTIAIIWAGYKFLFRNADMKECLMIVGGGLLIGGAAELASYLLGK